MKDENYIIWLAFKDIFSTAQKIATIRRVNIKHEMWVMFPLMMILGIIIYLCWPVFVATVYFMT